MADLTFQDLSLRSEVEENDTLVNYRKDSVVPEGLIEWSVLKKDLQRGTIIKNEFLSATQTLNITTDQQTITFKGEDGTFLNHKNILNNIFGVLQISCIKKAPSDEDITDIYKNTLCNFELRWNGKNEQSILLASGYVPINYYAGATDVAVGIYDVRLPSSNLCTMIPPFNPRAELGYYECNFWFTQTIDVPGAFAEVGVNLWMLETDAA